MEAYEGLRRQVVEPDGRVEHREGHGILRRCGLAAWAQLRRSTIPARPPTSHFQAASESAVLASLEAELVRLIAGLILRTQQEGFLRA